MLAKEAKHNRHIVVVARNTFRGYLWSFTVVRESETSEPTSQNLRKITRSCYDTPSETHTKPAKRKKTIDSWKRANGNTVWSEYCERRRQIATFCRALASPGSLCLISLFFTAVRIANIIHDGVRVLWDCWNGASSPWVSCNRYTLHDAVWPPVSSRPTI